MSVETLLDLALPRTIRLHDRGHNFNLICRRLEPADWIAYFVAIRITSEQDGKSRVNTMDFETPRVLLAERVLTATEGYKVAGDGKLESLPNWQTRIPLAHRRQLGATLADVRPSQADAEFVIHAEAEEVLLDATWSAIKPGAADEWIMQKFQGLKHIFKTPGQAQYKRYNQEASRSVVVGGSRSGKTIYAGAQRVLCELYDELVVSVEGYAWNGSPLSGVQQIRDSMDMHHKFTAAQELLNPASGVSAEDVQE